MTDYELETIYLEGRPRMCLYEPVLETGLRLVWDAALEFAAKVCDGQEGGKLCAAAIRSHHAAPGEQEGK